MANFRIVLAPGDGIGPEVTAEAVKVLHIVARTFGHRFDFEEECVGGVAIDKYGVALKNDTLARALASDAVLFGAVGDPKFDDPSLSVRPEQAILGLRSGLGLFANLRPVRVFDSVIGESPLKPEIVRGTDFLVIRELTGGIYFGSPKRRWVSGEGREAVDTMSYKESEIQRILKLGFELARTRKKIVTCVDKANILETSRLWREISFETAAEFPDVTLEHLLVDAAAMHIINNPSRFDVIVTSNMFGDILTDEAAVLAGSLGMMPSASLARLDPQGRGLGLYEPIHGSAPDIAGRGFANPIGMILSTAMMLRLSLGLGKEANAVERAVQETLNAGYRTADIASNNTRPVSTAKMGDTIAERIEP